MPKATRRDIEAARSLVRIRDGHQCQMCGQSVLNIPSSVHHRRPRGAGGSALLERASYLIRLCGTGTTGCHQKVEEFRTIARDTGWLISKLNLSIDPAETPILTIKGWVLLDDEGGLTYAPEPREAAV